MIFFMELSSDSVIELSVPNYRPKPGHLSWSGCLNGIRRGQNRAQWLRASTRMFPGIRPLLRARNCQQGRFRENSELFSRTEG